jgi:hypothetical protein
VEAFCARLVRGVDRLVDGGLGGYAEDYVASRAAWVSAPDARVNPLLMRAGAQLVSFYPCRFDCPRAVALAESLRAVVAARALQQAVIRPREPGAAAGYLYLVCRKPGLPAGRLQLLGASLVSPALVPVVAVILLISALAARMFARRAAIDSSSTATCPASASDSAACPVNVLVD